MVELHVHPVGKPRGDLALVHPGIRCQGRLFRVVEDNLAEGLGIRERPAHDQGRGDGLGPVGEADGARRGHQPYLGQLLAGDTLGYRAVGADVDQADGLGPAFHELDQ